MHTETTNMVIVLDAGVRGKVLLYEDLFLSEEFKKLRRIYSHIGRDTILLYKEQNITDSPELIKLRQCQKEMRKYAQAFLREKKSQKKTALQNRQTRVSPDSDGQEIDESGEFNSGSS